MAVGTRGRQHRSVKITEHFVETGREHRVWAWPRAVLSRCGVQARRGGSDGEILCTEEGGVAGGKRGSDGKFLTRQVRWVVMPQAFFFLR